MTVQEHYATTAHAITEAAVAATESLAQSWGETLRRTADQPVVAFAGVDPAAAVDQYFDVWAKALDAQREAAKQLVGATVAVQEKVRSRAESMGAVVREQGESVGRAIRTQATTVRDAARDAAHEHSLRTYDELTKPELQAELTRRGLAKTGNVDELRERLVEDDQN